MAFATAAATRLHTPKHAADPHSNQLLTFFNAKALGDWVKFKENSDTKRRTVFHFLAI